MVRIKEHGVDTVVGALRLLQYMMDGKPDRIERVYENLKVLAANMALLNVAGIDALCDRIRDERT